MPTIKTVGNNGQISLGKEYAGRTVLVDEVEPGVWIIKVGQFIPDSERWLIDPKVQKDLDDAIEWAKNHPPAETSLDDLEKRLRDE
ncbi:hypothetical protein [Kyrpidia spormannii]|uniref:Uncharacterized protein n=2 Tax=Kyrpidia spormannii TaxID=2055160 RepID=A0ACA8ZDU5_9BACL|nr:hypothetical protein [Kyrpidia spormannii]CAB3395488.1 conserved protein of unknown function [Kyrpidia spormannii]CAB3396172.1 conserved protein of unknown function [Kyrpidia spormannii]